MRFILMVLAALVFSCATEAPNPSVQLGGYGGNNDAYSPDLGRTQPDVSVEVFADVQPEVQEDTQPDTTDTQPEVQADVPSQDTVDTQPDVQADTQPDVQADTQPDISVQDTLNEKPDVQGDTQDIQPDVSVQDTQPETPDVQTQDTSPQPDVQADTKPDTSKPDALPTEDECVTKYDCKDQYSCTVDTCVTVLIGTKLINMCKHTGMQFNCDDGNQCTVDECGTSFGKCTNTITVNSCDDGNPCTMKETCKQGVCTVPTFPTLCDDGEECTVDSCDPKFGCVHLNRPDKTPCNNYSCDKGSCKSGVCYGEFLGFHSPGACIDDKNACTTVLFESCNKGLGCLPSPVKCDDKNPCTADSCVPATGCVFTPISGCKP